MKPYEKKSCINAGIILMNALYFVYLELSGSSMDSGHMLESGAMNAMYIFEKKEYYRLFTSLFMHFGISHIMNNMLILFVLGDNLERALGRRRYLVFYLGCGVGANLVSLFLPVGIRYISANYPFMDYVLTDMLHVNHYNYGNVVSAGASGAIFGVIGGLLYAVMINKGQLEDLSTRQLVVLIVFSMYFGFTSAGVDNTAHVAGLVIGILLAALLYRKPKRNRWPEDRQR